MRYLKQPLVIVNLRNFYFDDYVKLLEHYVKRKKRFQNLVEDPISDENGNRNLGEVDEVKVMMLLYQIDFGLETSLVDGYLMADEDKHNFHDVLVGDDYVTI